MGPSSIKKLSFMKFKVKKSLELKNLSLKNILNVTTNILIIILVGLKFGDEKQELIIILFNICVNILIYVTYIY